MFGYIRDLVSDYVTKLYQKIRRFTSKNLWYVLVTVALVCFLAGAVLGAEKVEAPEIGPGLVVVAVAEGQCRDERVFRVEALVDPSSGEVRWNTATWAQDKEPFLFQSIKDGAVQYIVVRIGADYTKYTDPDEANGKYSNVCAIPKAVQEKKAATDCLRCNKRA
jgi:hypothetical protein